MQTVDCVNNLCHFISTSTLRATADLLYATAKMVTETVGVSCHRNSSRPSGGTPPWKVWLQYKLNSMRQDLSRLVALQFGHLKSQNIVDALYNKYLTSGSSMATAIEALRQKITATSKKIAHYTARTEEFHQNKLFVTDQHKLYESLSSSTKPFFFWWKKTKTHKAYVDLFFWWKKGQCIVLFCFVLCFVFDTVPNDKDIVKFWTTLWGDDTPHNESASCKLFLIFFFIILFNYHLLYYYYVINHKNMHLHT